MINFRFTWTRSCTLPNREVLRGQSLSHSSAGKTTVSAPLWTHTHTHTVSVSVCSIPAFSLLWTESVSGGINKHDLFLQNPPTYTPTHPSLDQVEPSAYRTLAPLCVWMPWTSLFPHCLLWVWIHTPNICTLPLCFTHLHKLSDIWLPRRRSRQPLQTAEAPCIKQSDCAFVVEE